MTVDREGSWTLQDRLDEERATNEGMPQREARAPRPRHIDDVMDERANAGDSTTDE